MQKVSKDDIEWLLQPKDRFDFNTKSAPPTNSAINSSKRKKRRFLWRSFSFFIFSFSLVVVPFFVLIRTAVYLNISENWNGWMSLLGGMGTCILFLSALLFFILRRIKNKKRMVRLGLGTVSVLVGGFCIYGLLYLNSVNAKSEAVREVYQTLHPILRVAIASTTLAERNLLITDIKRTREDYLSMGLTPRETSMHYVQENGFVHAIDLRTIGHSELRNVSLEWSLKLMGFQTIRHIGTADHLHVALPMSD